MRSKKQYNKQYIDYANERFSVPAIIVVVAIVLALVISVAELLISYI